MPQFLPGAAAAHAGGLLRHDVRPGTRFLIADLDQDPAPLAGPGQREASGQLATVQHKGEVPGCVPDYLGGPLVPDDHRATAAHLTLMHTLELTGRQGVVFHRHGQPADSRIERWPSRDRPRAQYVACLQAEVEVQRRRVMQLDDEAGRRGHRLSMSPASAPASHGRELSGKEMVFPPGPRARARGCSPIRLSRGGPSLARAVAVRRDSLLTSRHSPAWGSRRAWPGSQATDLTIFSRPGDTPFSRLKGRAFL